MNQGYKEGDLPTTKPEHLGDVHFTAVVEVYRAKWGDARIEAQIDRIYESTRRETFGEVLLQHTSKDITLYQGRVNLISQSARAKAAAETYQRFEGTWDLTKAAWQHIFDTVCLRVLKDRRKGIPPVSAAAMEQPAPSRWRIKPYIQDGQATVLFGDGDSGKSMLATYWGTLTALGHLENHQVPEPGPVLYLDYETDAATWWERVDAMTNGLGVALPDTFHYRPMLGHRLADDITNVNKYVMDTGAELVIIDSAAPACGEPENVDAAVAYFNALRTLGPTVATLTVAHLPKNALASNNPFGSTFWRNLPRANWKVESAHQADGTLLVGLRHTKSNNGIRNKDRAFKFDFADQIIRVYEGDPNQVDALADSRPVADKIADALIDGAMTVQDIADAVDTSKNTVSVTLKRNPSRFVTFNAGGRWGLLHHGNP